jgi:hypothetical protein
VALNLLGAVHDKWGSPEVRAVSKIKTPQEKKQLSYDLDCRNMYFENNKSSRKNIPRSKQRSHQDERRTLRQVLSVAEGLVESDVLDDVQSQALLKGKRKKLGAFYKRPDKPLREVVQRRLRARLRDLD